MSPKEETMPPMNTPTKTKESTVPAIIKAREAPTKEDATFLKNDMNKGN
jgi:hypothetical protein